MYVFRVALLLSACCVGGQSLLQNTAALVTGLACLAVADAVQVFYKILKGEFDPSAEAHEQQQQQQQAQQQIIQQQQQQQQTQPSQEQKQMKGSPEDQQ
jgi:hypothetical protein